MKEENKIITPAKTLEHIDNEESFNEVNEKVRKLWRTIIIFIIILTLFFICIKVTGRGLM